MLSLHKCKNCGFDKYGKFLTNYDKETGIETMICPKCLTTGHPSLFLKTKEEVKLKPKNNYSKQKKKTSKDNIEFNIIFGVFILIAIASRVMSLISDHYESKSIQYRNSIIKPEPSIQTNGERYRNNQKIEYCYNKAESHSKYREYKNNYGEGMTIEEELAMAEDYLKDCGD